MRLFEWLPSVFGGWKHGGSACCSVSCTFALRRCLGFNHCLVWHLKIAISKFQHLSCRPCKCGQSWLLNFLSKFGVWQTCMGSDAHPGGTLLSNLPSSVACSLPGCQDALQQLCFSDFLLVLSPALSCHPTDYLTVIMLSRSTIFSSECRNPILPTPSCTHLISFAKCPRSIRT